MMTIAKPTDQAFLVQVNGTQFLFEMKDHEITGTTVLSAAKHYDYFAADQVCQALRRRGHPVAVVCNCFGRPVTADELRGDPPISFETLIPTTKKEYDAMPASIVKRRMAKEPAFVTAIDQLFS